MPKEFIQKLVWKEKDFADLLIQLWNKEINYTSYIPKIAFAKLKDNEKDLRVFDPFFVFKLFAIRYDIDVPLLYIKDLHNIKSPDKFLVIFKKDGSGPEIHIDKHHSISGFLSDGNIFYYHAFVCIYS